MTQILNKHDQKAHEERKERLSLQARFKCGIHHGANHATYTLSKNVLNPVA
jgi:hypothetical protein